MEQVSLNHGTADRNEESELRPKEQVSLNHDAADSQVSAISGELVIVSEASPKASVFKGDSDDDGDDDDSEEAPPVPPPSAPLPMIPTSKLPELVCFLYHFFLDLLGIFTSEILDRLSVKLCFGR